MRTLLLLLLTVTSAAAVIPDTDLNWTNAPVSKPTAPSVAPADPAASLPAPAATNATSGKAAAAAKPANKSAHGTAPAQSVAQMQAALDQLAQTNREQLDLLKRQMDVLRDLQFDRRQQSHEIQSLEERLEETMTEKHLLENKVAKLEAEAAVRPMAPPRAETSGMPARAGADDNGSIIITPRQQAAPVPIPEPTPPPVPESYLPPEGRDPGWHRLMTLKGGDNRQTEPFKIQGKTWRVLWHNQDKPGKTYANTSALFINAFPKDDSIPQKVCSKLGTGGDSAEMRGPGTYYLKIEASGGSWELAVEDSR